MCLYPREIRNPKYRKNKKNQGIIPPCPDDRLLTIMIPCGKCMECHKQKGRQWAIRLMQEIRDDPRAVMVTLTFNTEHLTALTTTAMEKGCTWGYSLDNALAKLSIRRFYERWRKNYGGKTLKHWLVTELGKGATEHLHLHGILWTDHPERIKDTWQYGYVHIGKYVNERTCNYMMKYFLKPDDRHPNYKPVILTSPGIGKGYIKSSLARFNGYNGKQTAEYFVRKNGQKTQLPKYFRDKIYTDQEKEELRLHKIDSDIKYMGGRPINIKHNEYEYHAIYSGLTQQNKRLGFGPTLDNDQVLIKENARRAEIQKKRLATNGN